MAPRTRRPTGRVPWPLILVEGSEKSGKSWACAELSTSDRIGQMYWLDLAEGTADEYAAIPGADYLVIEHDGSWPDIVAQVEEVRAVAAIEQQAGRKPVALVIDSMTAEWDLLKGVIDGKARARLAKRGKAVAPDAEPQISMDLWNEANARHRRLMTSLMTFPGIVIMTARGKDVAALDAGGRPVEGRKEYKVEGHKNLAFDASAWVRLSRDSAPQVIGARSVHAGIRPGVDRPQTAPNFSLEWLIFDVLKCDPEQARPRQMAAGAPERTAEEIAAEALLDATGPERLRELHKEAAVLGLLEATVTAGDREGRLGDLIAYLGRQRAAQGPATDAQHRQMHALWRETGLADDRDGRIAFTAEIVGREIASSKELTSAEADAVIARLKSWHAQQEQAETEGAAA
jgi:hypothetical protein